MAVDEQRLNAFMARALGDMGAAASLALCILGERLGLYKAMAGAGPLTSAQLAQKTGTAERYVREWLMNQAAGGYVTYDAATQAFTLPDEQAMALAQEGSPVFLHGAFDVIQSIMHDWPKVERAFRSGGGVEWGEHHPCLFSGTERFFRPAYAAHLIGEWLPALDGVAEKLRHGGNAADIGCGHGASTILMALAFPKSRFLGIDAHAPSIDAARERAKEAGVTNATFTTASAYDFQGDGFDLVACFDCLHDMGDPVAAARRIRRAIKPQGTWMVVEPMAGDRPEENLNPLGRMFYAASTMICVPASLAAHGPALGAQAGEARLRKVLTEGGFTKVRRAAQTPFNMVLEARA